MAAINGTAVRSDSSRIDGTARVSTSWNSNVAFPTNGHYRLDVGSNPRKTYVAP